MGCKGCTEKPKNTNRDRNGNINGTQSEMDQYEKDNYSEINQKFNALKLNDRPNPDASYQEHVDSRAQHKQKIRELGPVAVRTLTDDQKRIRVFELISIFNYDDVGMLTPGQALVALHEFMSIPEYSNIMKEFEGLQAQVSEKYEALMKNKIQINWNK